LPSSVFILNAGAAFPSTLALAGGTAATALAAVPPPIIENTTKDVANNFVNDFMNRSLIELFKTNQEDHPAFSGIKQRKRNSQQQMAACFLFSSVSNCHATLKCQKRMTNAC
jgi:hypothetical protein